MNKLIYYRSFNALYSKLSIPKLLFAYFLWGCFPKWLRIHPYYFHLYSYSYEEPSVDSWLLKVEKKPQLQPNCPVVPTFNASDWKQFREKINEKIYLESNYQSQSIIRFQEVLISRGFPYESSWTPSTCSPVHDVTIIVTYMNRLDQLKKFVVHIHPFLRLQKVSYRIILVEQANHAKFNKGKLYNAAFIESQKRFPSDCYIFHDVDLLPEHLGNVYGCTKKPRFLSAQINSWRFHLSYDECFGGVVSTSSEQYKLINGYSNSYNGWGAEDDDFFLRVIANNLTVTRFNPEVSSYRMTPHIKEEPGDFEDVYKKWKERLHYDGLNSVKYDLVAFKDDVGFTAIQVHV